MIYVPCGLTALRANLPNYMIPYGLPIGEEKMYTIFRNQRKTGVKTILCDENRGNAIYPARGIPMFLNVALSLFEKMGIRRIAMNGIRVYWSDGVKDHGHLAEAFLLDSALQWLDTYEHHFESMDFVAAASARSIWKIPMNRPLSTPRPCRSRLKAGGFRRRICR